MIVVDTDVTSELMRPSPKPLPTSGPGKRDEIPEPFRSVAA
jgi:hypothetical protein